MNTTEIQNLDPMYWGKIFTNPLVGPFVAGGCAGALEATCTHPTTIWRYCKQLNKPLPDSFKGFYKGLSVNMGAMIPFFSTLVGVNALAKNQLNSLSDVNNAFSNKLGSALFAAVAGSLILNPTEVTLIQQRALNEKDLTSVAKKIFKEAGFKGFYKALTPAFLRNTIYSMGIHMLPKEGSDFQRVAMSGLAGLFGGAISQPFDVVNTRMKRNITSPTSMFGMMKEIFKNEGWKEFYRASVPRLARTGGGSAVVTFALDSLMNKKN